MKIIFDNENQKVKFVANMVCPDDLFDDGPSIFNGKCPGANTSGDCIKCWEKYVEMEVKNE